MLEKIFRRDDSMQKRLAVGLVAFLLLLIWWQASQYWCYSLILPFLFLIMITRNTYTYAKAKKICLGRCYFNEKSLLYFFWTRKTWIFTVAFFIGAVLTASLVLSSFQFTPVDLGMIFADTFVIVSIYSYLEKNETFNRKVKMPLIKNISSWLNAVLMVTAFFFIAYFQTPPDYLRPDLIATFEVIKERNYSACKPIDAVAYVSSLIVAARWWALMKITLMNESYLTEILWMLQLLGNYMMIFAYSRFVLELVDIFSSGSRRERDAEHETVKR